MTSSITIKKSSGKDGDSFVGMKISDGEIHLYFPESYDFPQDHIDFNEIGLYRDELISYLESLSLTKKSETDENDIDLLRSDSSQMIFSSYIWILRDYLANGFPIKFERKLKIFNDGKINWKKTIQTCEPVLSGGNIIYLNTYREHNHIENDIISEAYRYCLSESIRYAGWLFQVGNVAESSLEFTISRKEEYYYEVKKRLDTTFEEIRKIRLQHMLNIIRAIHIGKTNKTVEYGADQFDMIFQKIVNEMFGNVKDINRYYPKATYYLDGDTYRTYPLMPDTILDEEKEVYVIDSKNYRYGTTNDPANLPPTDSIQKQLTYAEFIKEKRPGTAVYNSFVLPAKISPDTDGNDGFLTWVGYALSDWKKTTKNIILFISFWLILEN